jgi:flagellar M-ring protein FliF
VEQLKKLWAAMSATQRLSIGVVGAAACAAIFWLVSWRHEASFKPLYHGLAREDAAQALQKLKEAGVEFRLEDEGNTILVSADKLAETRLILAREGLPKAGRIGFELFDKTSFGTTEFAEQVNYGRALEGELERTISALGEIERARVHLTFPKDSVFLEKRQPAKASVLLNLRRAASLSAVNVAAIAHLVASAVEGLSPEQVTIVDSHGDLLNKPRRAESLSGISDAQLEYRIAVERDLQNKLSQTLDPVLGLGAYRAGVSVECDFAGVEESEEVWDPTKSVMVSSQRTQESAGGHAGGGVPGTASNLPNPPERSTSGSGTARVTENTSFQSSRRVRHVQQPRGAIKRISVAVLLDQEARWERSGGSFHRVFVPPPPDKLSVIRNLVTNVAGINATRGDQITVETLAFDGTLREEPPKIEQTAQPQPATGESLTRYLRANPKILAGAAAALLAVILLIWRVTRSRRRKKITVTETAPQIAHPAAEAARAAPKLTAGPPAQPDNRIESMMMNQDQLLAAQQQELIESLKAPMMSASKSEALTKYLRQEVKRDPQATTQLLRTWLLEE